MMRLSLLTLPLIAAGCATTTGNDAPATTNPYRCEAAPALDLVGKAVTQSLGSDAMAKSGARTLRWIPEGSAVTMDYREDRLNIAYDSNNIVTSITCG